MLPPVIPPVVISPKTTQHMDANQPRSMNAQARLSPRDENSLLVTSGCIFVQNWFCMFGTKWVVHVWCKMGLNVWCIMVLSILCTWWSRNQVFHFFNLLMLGWVYPRRASWKSVEIEPATFWLACPMLYQIGRATIGLLQLGCCPANAHSKIITIFYSCLCFRQWICLFAQNDLKQTQVFF